MLDAESPVGAAGGSFCGSARVVTVNVPGLRSIAVIAHGYDGIVVGGLRLHGGVGVRRGGASRVRLYGGQVGGGGSAQDAVPGYPRVLRIVPSEGQAVVFDVGRSESGGRRRRVVLDPLGNGGGPRSAPLANRAVGVVVTRPDFDLVAVARRQAIKRLCGNVAVGIEVAPLCFVGILVGKKP